MEPLAVRKKKTRLIVRQGKEHIALRIEDIAVIYRDNFQVVAVDRDERTYICEKNLSALEEDLDETQFFRANRQYLVNSAYIRGFRPVAKVKLEIFLTLPSCAHRIIVSQECAPLFRKWIAEE